MVFLWSFPPATADLPVYKALRADLAASGDEALQPENLKASPMRSWIGLYALLKMIRDAKMTDVHPRRDHRDAASRRRTSRCSTSSAARTGRRTSTIPGIFKRAGTNHWAIYEWDPDAEGAGRARGQLRREVATISFDEVLCGSIFGAPKALLTVIGRAGVALPPDARGHEPPGRPVTCSRSCSS